MIRAFRFLIPLVIVFIAMIIPRELFPFEGLTVIQHRVILIFLFATFFWILEPIPIYATSLAIILFELLFISNKGIILFRMNAGTEVFGDVLPYADIMATMAHPIILLFLGGFFLAIAATKYKMDVNLARFLLKPFGTNPRIVILGLMLITAIFSMFMSNTATTAMMLAIIAPLLALFDKQDPGRVALALCIPFAANIGGIGTPIGTPPNAIALRYLTGDLSIGFGEWMQLAVPYAIVMLFITWVLILLFFPPKQKTIHLSISTTFDKSPKAIIVYVTSIITILLWTTGSLHGMNSYIVGVIPVAVFSFFGVITKDDLKHISWDVLWLVAGGFALGLALDKTGLATLVVQSIPFNSFPVIAVLLFVALITAGMATFMSNTATANLLMPMMVALGSAMEGLKDMGGTTTIILIVAFSASLGMSLPISTPPNALAHATGNVSTSQMARVGVIITVVGILLTFFVTNVLRN